MEIIGGFMIRHTARKSEASHGQPASSWVREQQRSDPKDRRRMAASLAKISPSALAPTCCSARAPSMRESRDSG
jgi:hypothetical protein